MSEAKGAVNSRRLAREAAYQACYMMLVGGATAETAVRVVLSRQALAEESEKFLHQLVEGVAATKNDLDAAIEPHLAEGWSLTRLAASDLTALRLCAFELLHFPGIPPKVSISEAVDLAKRFGSEHSGPFVNGVLGSLLPQTPKAQWDPSMEDHAPEPTIPTQMPDEPEDDEQEIPSEPGLLAAGWTIRSGSAGADTPVETVEEKPRFIPVPADDEE